MQFIFIYFHFPQPCSLSPLIPHIILYATGDSLYMLFSREVTLSWIRIYRTLGQYHCITFCGRRCLWTSKTKITERNPNADAWSSLKSFQLSTCSRNYFQLQNYCYHGSLFKKVPCITELLLSWKPVTGTNHGPIQPPEDGQQVYEHM